MAKERHYDPSILPDRHIDLFCSSFTIPFLTSAIAVQARSQYPSIERFIENSCTQTEDNVLTAITLGATGALLACSATVLYTLASDFYKERYSSSK